MPTYADLLTCVLTSSWDAGLCRACSAPCQQAAGSEAEEVGRGRRGGGEGGEGEGGEGEEEGKGGEVEGDVQVLTRDGVTLAENGVH